MPKNHPQKRLRIFAGPNGSGKSTLYPKIKEQYRLQFGYYVNADNIYETLEKNGFIDGSTYGIRFSYQDFKKFYEKSSWKKYITDRNFFKKWVIGNNIIAVDKKKLKISDPAILADYIRVKLLDRGVTFTFETVMSHKSKIDFIKKATSKGYKVYLYFIATENPEINMNRVKLRVEKGGHDVPDELIKLRYENTLNQLTDAIKSSYRSFLFDNTNEIIHFASVGPEKVVRFEKSLVPRWFKKYVLDKIKV